ncbi:MAG: polyhydroxyalkanoic acid system family protein [Gammaproteobacteria bacterium]|nr:polyhydroxyalkanoic acid system family protein [Gammaproteobacteria bacterium]
MKIHRRHKLGLEEARNRADKIAADLQQQFSMRSRWQGDVLKVKGNGVKGQLLVDEENLELDVKLGLALKLMEGPIRAAIEATIDEELA